MATRHRLDTCVIALSALCALALSVGSARAQIGGHPWGGIAADEARSSTGETSIESFVTELSPHALSGDGRFVVFSSRLPLVADDTNDEWDVYVRDRQTMELTRVSVAVGGGDANGGSWRPSISPDGRYLAFDSTASNLVAGDTNLDADGFVYDRELQTMALVTLDASGGQSTSAAGGVRISDDGRYVVFIAQFGGNQGHETWFRDRDADGNGVFDEPGLTATTIIPRPSPDAGEQFFSAWPATMSGDGRYIALSHSALTESWQSLGMRRHVYDRVTGTTIPLGAPAPGTIVDSSDPDFSDTGHVVFATNVPDLVAGDNDVDMDVFVFNLFTGGYERLQLVHAGAPELVNARNPAISGDGRFVAFLGSDLLFNGGHNRNVYAVDRQSGESFEISLRFDSARSDGAGDYPSISADGSAIAFLSNNEILATPSPVEGVYVATALSMTPESIDVSQDGETVSIEVTAPANTAWEVLTSEVCVQLYRLEVWPTSGVGSATIEATLPENRNGEPCEYVVSVGSERVVLRQAGGPYISGVFPSDGPAAGGTEVLIVGNGFSPDATVTFGGLPAASVLIEHSSVIRAVTPPSSQGSVDVVVTNGDGVSTTVEFGFFYFEPTNVAPAAASGVFGGSVSLRATLTGRSGVQSGRVLRFLVSNVFVGQAVTGADGMATVNLALGSRPAGIYPVRVDFWGDDDLWSSTGNSTLSIDRAPLTIRANDAVKEYGASLPAFDATAMGFVNGDTMAVLSGALTLTTAATGSSAPGTYPITPAGVSSSNYTITFIAGSLTVDKATTTLTLTSSPNPSRPRRTVELRAQVAATAGAPAGFVDFHENGRVLGTAQLWNGVATVHVEFRRGTHIITATYRGSETFLASSATRAHVTR